MHPIHVIVLLLTLLLAAATGHAATTAPALARVPAGQWIQWQIPLEPGNTAPCCRPAYAGRSGCTLAAEPWNFAHDSDDRGGDLYIYVRSDGQGSADRVKAAGTQCPLDAQGESVTPVTLDPVAQAALLEQVATGGGKAARAGAVAALGLSAGTAATDTLTRLAGAGTNDAVRRDALFWLGVARGAAAVPLLQAQLARTDQPRGLQEHTVFALSQNRSTAADQALTELTRRDAPQAQRAEALFWLAQTRPATAAPVLLQALTDPAPAIREKAVFALSQLPADDAVPALIRISRDRALPADTRRQAVFWLGQLDHPEATAALEGLLGVR